MAILGRSQDSVVLAKFSSLSIHLPDPDVSVSTGDRQSSAFRLFVVYDERVDSNRIGIFRNSFFESWARYKQLVFEHPVPEVLSGYLNDRFARPGAPYTALIVLRTLWLGNANYIKEDLVKDTARRSERTRIRLKAEVYALRDSVYIPVFRFDTTEASPKKSMGNWGQHLADMLEELVDSASHLISLREGRGRTISLGDILAYNKSRRDPPIRQDSALVKGVYANFQEFLHNAPSIHDFEIKMEKNDRLLYVSEGGQTYFSHTCWGYCDGKRIFIMQDGILQPVWKEGKAYYFAGKADVSTNSPGPNGPVTPQPAPFPGNHFAPASPPPGDYTTMFPGLRKEYTYFKRIYTIDLDSGKFY
jgi:hypothetical protein